tara:strand:- start:2599 stop:3930 length:1332 start_codon:yes stop_codon:yes gene_type:complete
MLNRNHYKIKKKTLVAITFAITSLMATNHAVAGIICAALDPEGGIYMYDRAGADKLIASGTVPDCNGMTVPYQSGEKNGRLQKKIQTNISNDRKAGTWDSIDTPMPTKEQIKQIVASKFSLPASPEEAKEAITQALIEYSDMGDQIEKASKFYNLSQKLVYFDANTLSELKNGAIRKKDEFVSSVSDMSQAEKALNVAYLRCSQDDGNVHYRQFTQKQKIKYTEAKAQICTGIQKLYEIKQKVDQLRSIRENGLSLKYNEDKMKIEFVAGIKRTLRKSIDIRWYPDIQGAYEEGKFQFNVSLDNDRSWIQFSDGERMLLADILNQEPDETSLCHEKGLLWFKLSKEVQLRVAIKDVTADNAIIGSCVKMKILGKIKDYSFPDVNIPAPYGYLAELTEMKDNAIQNATDELASAILSMLPISGRMDQVTGQVPWAGPDMDAEYN